MSVRQACKAFGLSETCYRYVGKRDEENGEVAQWLLRLTDNHRTWGFSLCFLYLRNVKGYSWNHMHPAIAVVHACLRDLLDA
ncbi:hypothetical protein KPG66_07515, partial [Mycetohabitans sp. B2]|nr:hypothetical protein [Mycetohabitans sp. B2]